MGRLPKPPAGPSRRCGCGGRGRASLTWTRVGGRICVVSISSTPTGSPSTLGWTTPALCTPAQADRWTWLVVAAYTQLRLARGLIDDLRLPWERPREPAKLTPARVRRGFHRLGATLGTPASPPKSDIPGPGRPKGTRRPPRTRYPSSRKPHKGLTQAQMRRKRSESLGRCRRSWSMQRSSYRIGTMRWRCSSCRLDTVVRSTSSSRLPDRVAP